MRAAVYAGTFDPITLGHRSVIDRARQLFDRVLVVVAVNPEKQPLFSVEERLAMIRETSAAFGDVEALATAGLVVELAREQGAGYLVRGVRGNTDTEQEIALANLNHALAPEIETVFIPAHPELSEISSSRLKELAARGADVSRYCAEEVRRRLTERLRPGEVPGHV